MQQGVQTDTTCNIQQCWDLLANSVASVCTGLIIRNLQTALKLPESFKIPQTACFCQTAILHLKNKNFRKAAPKIEQKCITANLIRPPQSPTPIVFTLKNSI